MTPVTHANQFSLMLSHAELPMAFYPTYLLGGVEHTRATVHTCGDRCRTTQRDQVSPSTMCVLGMELRSLGSAADTLT